MKVDSLERQQAEIAACKTSELLATQGWCLWRCDVLNGEVIRIVDEDIVEEAPGGPPVYSIREIETLLELEVVDIRLIHEAKKAAGARITGVDAKAPIPLGSNRGGVVDQNMY